MKIFRIRGGARWRGAVLWVTVLAILALDMLLSLVNLREIQRLQESVDHSYRVLAQLDLLLANLNDAETAQRGFIITGDADYLRPYEEASRRFDERLERLSALTHDNSERQASLQELKPLVAEKFSELAITITLRRVFGRGTAEAVVLSGRGKKLMDSIRVVLESMRNREINLLGERTLAARDKYRATVAAVIGGGLLTMGITGLAFFLVRTELSRRRQAEAEASRRQSELAITAHGLALEQRHTAEALATLEGFLTNAPIGFAFLDAELRINRLNQPFADANGSSIDALLGRTMMEIASAFALASVVELRQVLHTERALIDRQVVGAASDSSPARTWQTSFFPIGSRVSGLLGIGVIVRDITRRLQNEHALRDSQTRFRNLAEAMPQFVWVARPDGFVEYFNRRWYEYTGLSVEQTIGFRWGVPIHPEDRLRVEQQWRHATDTGEQFELEYRLCRADGSYRWFLGRARAQRDDTGRVVTWFGTSTDIHDRRIAEEELRRSLARFRSLAESIPQIVWTGNPRGLVEYCNQRWLDFTGLTFEQSVGREWHQVVHPDDRSQLIASWVEAIQAGEPFRAEVRLPSSTLAENSWHLVDATPVHNEDGRIVQWVGTLTNIDERKRQAELLEELVRVRTAELSRVNASLAEEVSTRKAAEEKERAAADELRRSNLELEQFAYVASHDLQEPLRKIQTFADRLIQTFPTGLGEQGQQYLDRIRSSATRMRKLIEDLLSFSRIATHPRPFVNVDLTEVVNRVLVDLEERIAQTEAKIEVGTLHIVEGDPSQLQQLLQNLLVNALKFRRPDVRPVVAIRSELELDRSVETSRIACRLTVVDNGIGFDDQFRERIFQIFQRLHGRSQYEGTGIGLAICRKIVERHHGTITATAALGQGATFTVILPTPQIASSRAAMCGTG